MSKTVFILGAGASKRAGAPLMAEFLDRAKDLSTHEIIRKDTDTYKAFVLVFEAIHNLRISHFKSYIDLDNIESVFGAFEMARLIKRMVNYSSEEIEELISSMKKLIVKTLELSMVYNPLDPIPLPPYNEFAHLLKDLRGKKGNDACSILTFNYDVALDYALLKNQIGVDYSLLTGEADGKLRLLKLHGSLNWGLCPKCKNIVPVHISTFKQGCGFKVVGRKAFLNVGSNLVSHKHVDCGTPLEPNPILVPPTWNKTEYHGQLGLVWSQAGKELSSANNIIVIGYSHPISDQFFRYLFSLGSIGHADIRRFWVFDPVPKNGPVEAAYRELVGTGIEIRFKYFPMFFRHSLDILRKLLD